ncbi:hypothetical protein AX769_05400 [Frondihabitans sp. PAMC 28766]|uniref:hypothetical protein n=1 Tax=Frondihabitans sp. PAMC 28766 TaxID=1795630 RepID=UPI00078BFB65|nr:hypothetical protein [Frondihabitans sp. PAMC 28766]AMM19682.1 hypothetical protein AX769_05400 [Frondihabitans sp. PAMC 28766]
MELLIGVGVIALLVVGIGRWVRPARPKPPVASSPPPSAASSVDGGAMLATPAAPSTEVQSQGAGSGAGGSWAEAQRLRGLLLARRVPPVFTSWQLVPEPGEVFFYELGADYERFYGQEVGYRPASGFYFGSPAFILAGLAVSGITNVQRRRDAAAQSATQWRELEAIRFVVTNHRLLCLVGGQWVSFHYGAMTAVYPEVASGALICEFTGVPPLRLQGPDVAIAAVMTVFATHGLQAVAEHPSLQVLG